MGLQQVQKAGRKARNYKRLCLINTRQINKALLIKRKQARKPKLVLH